MDKHDKGFLLMLVLVSAWAVAIVVVSFSVVLPVTHWLYIATCNLLGVPQ